MPKNEYIIDTFDDENNNIRAINQYNISNPEGNAIQLVVEFSTKYSDITIDFLNVSYSDEGNKSGFRKYVINEENIDTILVDLRSSDVNIYESDTDKFVVKIYSDKKDGIDSTVFWAIFSSMCISECGDRTQFTAMIMSGVYEMWGVLLGSSLALSCSVFLGVFFGKQLIKYLHENVLNFILGIIFLGYSVQLYLGKTVF